MNGNDFVYLNIPSFYEAYHPDIVHEAMVEAQKVGSLVLDLRENGGGNHEHFMQYFLKPGTVLHSYPSYGALETGFKETLQRGLQGYHWRKLPAEVPFLYGGDVAILIDQNTACAAEACAHLFSEYSDLRKFHHIEGNSYQGETSVGRSIIFGNSPGIHQVAGSQILKTSLGDFVFEFPYSEILSPIYQNQIEGKGVSGESWDLPLEIRTESEMQQPEVIRKLLSDSEIKKALSWLNEARENSPLMKANYSKELSYLQIFKETAKIGFHSEKEKLSQAHMSLRTALLSKLEKAEKAYFHVLENLAYLSRNQDFTLSPGDREAFKRITLDIVRPAMNQIDHQVYEQTQKVFVAGLPQLVDFDYAEAIFLQRSQEAVERFEEKDHALHLERLKKIADHQDVMSHDDPSLWDTSIWWETLFP